MVRSSALSALARLSAMPSSQGLEALSASLARTERWPRAELERQQLLRLEELTAHAEKNVPFYATRLRAATTARNLSLDHFRQVPLLTREDLQEEFAAMSATTCPPAHRVVHERATSGSTGRPVRVRIDATCEALDRALGLRHHLWHRHDLDRKAASIRGLRRGGEPKPSAEAPPRWSAHPSSGPLLLLDVRTPIDEQLDWLVREAPAYLGTNATNALELVLRAEERDVRWSELRGVNAFAEVIPDGLREACKRVWDVPVTDAYSSTELGFISFDCPAFEGQHVQSENVLVEILDEDGAPCEAGEWGRVVVTALHAFAMPLIRYDIGDFARVGDRCSCGRELPLLSRILGRVRNMLVLPNGERIWPVFGANAFAEIAPVRQFRLVQRTLDELVLELSVRRPLSPGEETALRDRVLRTLGRPLRLELAYVSSVPRAPNGKFEEFRSEVPDGAQRSQ